MRAKHAGYRSLDVLHTESDNAASYWKLIAILATWMLLAGFLILPTTYDIDPQLRFSKGVLTIIVVTFLTGGYSLTFLLFFACPSLIFRQHYIFIPTSSSAAFGFFASVWALMTSHRYVASALSCPITIVLTLISTVTYGGAALWTHRRIKHTTRAPVWPSSQQAWQDTTYPQTYVPSPYVGTTRTSEASTMYQAPPMTEDEQVNHQMAMLLMKTDSGPSPDATQGTFRLEWPPGGDEDEGLGRRNRSRTFSGHNKFLAPGYRNRSGSAVQPQTNSAWGRIGRVIGISVRGRPEDRAAAQRTERARSREERRREIELGHMS